MLPFLLIFGRLVRCSDGLEPGEKLLSCLGTATTWALLMVSGTTEGQEAVEVAFVCTWSPSLANIVYFHEPVQEYGKRAVMELDVPLED